jgi:hypothetical protein
MIFLFRYTVLRSMLCCACLHFLLKHCQLGITPLLWSSCIIKAPRGHPPQAVENSCPFLFRSAFTRAQIGTRNFRDQVMYTAGMTILQHIQTNRRSSLSPEPQPLRNPVWTHFNNSRASAHNVPASPPWSPPWAAYTAAAGAPASPLPKRQYFPSSSHSQPPAFPSHCGHRRSSLPKRDRYRHSKIVRSPGIAVPAGVQEV